MFCQTLDKKFPRPRVSFVIFNDFLLYALPVVVLLRLELVLILILELIVVHVHSSAGTVLGLLGHTHYTTLYCAVIWSR